MSNQANADGDAQHANSTNETGGFVFGDTVDSAEDLAADGDVRATSEDGPLRDRWDAYESAPTYVEPYADEPEYQARIDDQGKYGIMYSGEYDWDTKECVRRAYGDANDLQGRSLQFHTEWLRPEVAAEWLDYMGPYNRFGPDLVRAAFDELPADAWVALAREFSPAIYIHTAKPRTVMDMFEDLESDAARRRRELRERCEELLANREDLPDQSVVRCLMDQRDYSGEFGDLLAEYDATDTFAAGGPDECGAFDGDEYPTKCVGEQDVADGQLMTVRLWFD